MAETMGGHSGWEHLNDEQIYGVLDRLKPARDEHIDWAIGALVMRGSITAEEAVELFEENER